MIVVEHAAGTRARKTGVRDVRLALSSAGGTGFSSSVRVRRHVVRGVPVLAVPGRLTEAVDDLDLAVRHALADGPRGVVCDLSAALEGAEPFAVESLAAIGRHVRDWPGVPVVVACPDPLVRDLLAEHPLGAHLIVTESLFTAVSVVLAAAAPAIERLQVAPHPTAPHASRNFVTRTLLDWRLGRAIPFATRLVGDLVTSSAANAGTGIDLSLAWNQGVLRLTVRDHGPALPDPGIAALALQRRAISIVAGLSRAFGVFPCADGGRLVWAVLDVPLPRTASSRLTAGAPAPAQESPIFTDGHGMTELPFCAGGVRRQAGDPASRQVVSITRQVSHCQRLPLSL